MHMYCGITPWQYIEISALAHQSVIISSLSHCSHCRSSLPRPMQGCVASSSPVCCRWLSTARARCVRACVRACVCVCMCACVHVYFGKCKARIVGTELVPWRGVNSFFFFIGTKHTSDHIPRYSYQPPRIPPTHARALHLSRPISVPPPKKTPVHAAIVSILSTIVSE